MLQTLLWALPIETIHEKTVVTQKDLGHINFSKLYVVVNRDPGDSCKDPQL